MPEDKPLILESAMIPMNPGVGNSPQTIVIDVPGYKGEDRRQFSAPCDCHKKHERVLSDHDIALGDVESSIKGIVSERKHDWEEHDKRREDSLKDLWDDVKIMDRSKVPNKLFYLFVSAYSVLFILGLITVYTGMHKNTLTFTVEAGEIKSSIAIVKKEMQYRTANEEKIERALQEMRTDLNHLSGRYYGRGRSNKPMIK